MQFVTSLYRAQAVWNDPQITRPAETNDRPLFTDAVVAFVLFLRYAQ